LFEFLEPATIQFLQVKTVYVKEADMIYREKQLIGPNSLLSFAAGTIFDLDMW
jgi:hypothetical protein